MNDLIAKQFYDQHIYWVEDMVDNKTNISRRLKWNISQKGIIYNYYFIIMIICNTIIYNIVLQKIYCSWLYDANFT